MREPLESRINARVPRRVKESLTLLARRRRLEASDLARTLLDEALRRENHPGIVFRQTPVGREAAIEGRRLYVWQVMETLQASGGDEESAAAYLGIRPDQVRSAAAYHADYATEIDDLSERNREYAGRARRRRALEP